MSDFQTMRKLLDDFGDDRPDCLDEWLYYVRKLEDFVEKTMEAADLPLTLHQLHIAARLLGLRCDCFDCDTSPPTDWGPGEHREPIPHHVECPFYPFELPDPKRCPTAYADAMEDRNRLIEDLSKILDN